MAERKKAGKKAKTVKAKRPAKKLDTPLLRLELPSSSTITVSRLWATALTQLSTGRATSDRDDWRSSVANETEQTSYSLSKGGAQ